MSSPRNAPARGSHHQRSRASIACMTCRKRKVKVSQTSAPDVLDTDNSSVTSSQWKAGSRAGYAVPLELNAPSTMMTTGRCRTTMLVPTDTRLTTDRNASKKHVRRLEERLEFLESTIRNLQGSGERKNSAQPAAIDGEELSRVSSASSSGNSTPAVATDDQANQEISNGWCSCRRWSIETDLTL